MMIKVMDGNEATAYISYAFTEAAVLFPITPSTLMCEKVEGWVAKKRKNVFGYSAVVQTMESEIGVAGAMHGLLKSGVLTSTYTCSQGLLLMMPTLYKMVGELLPAVIHVSARAVATSGLNIYGDHSDVMSLRPTGVVMLASGSVQEAALFSATSHLVAMIGRLPIIHFFDGFNTSHELRKIRIPTYEQLSSYLDEEAVNSFKVGSLSNFKPKATGVVIQPDVYFEHREAAHLFHLAMEELVEDTIQKLNPLFGTSASSVEYFGSSIAKQVIVIMGSAQETVKQVVKQRNRRGGEVGVIIVHLYRPFPKKLFLQRLPSTVEMIAVLDRTKESGAAAEPLMLDVVQTCKNHFVIGGRYGLGGKETTQNQIHAVFDELSKEAPKQIFTIGLTDDVTELSLETKRYPLCTSDLQIQVWGFGSDGSVMGVRDFLKVIGEGTINDVQGHFHYSPHKSRGLTLSYITIDQNVVQGSYTDQLADILICNQVDYLHLYEIVNAIKQNGKLLLNTQYSEDELNQRLSTEIKKRILDKNLRIYIIPATTLVKKYQLDRKINIVMMTCLFHLTKLLCKNQAMASYKQILLSHDFMKNDTYKQRVHQAIDESWEHLHEISLIIDGKSLDLSTNMSIRQTITTKEILTQGLVNGDYPLGGSVHLPTVQSDVLPCWKKDACKQCNLCTFVCPHSAIRSFILSHEKQLSTREYIPYNKNSAYKFCIQIMPERCTGCGLCIEVCPLKEKALVKQKASLMNVAWERKNWDYLVGNNANAIVKGGEKSCQTVSFSEPLCAFSGACAGCGETPYVKLLTQLFGERLSIANATGCSMIWGASAPYIAYYQDKNGMGPTWSSSLFENNSAYGYGINAGHRLIRTQCYQQLAIIASDNHYLPILQELSKQLIEEDGKIISTVKKFLSYCEKSKNPILDKFSKQRQFLINRTQWLIGGDGWAYDIDSGGLDHLLTSNENINILILDNEGYANTGGQLSKGTPTDAKTKLASQGNKGQKKDFGYWAMQYENVYVAQVALMANPAQTLNAFKEAEAYDGVSVILAYVPCVIQKRKDSPIASSKKAVASGYWPLYRFNPNASRRMKLDSTAPCREKLKEFLQADGRYNHSSMQISALDELEKQAQKRYFNYLLIKKLSEFGGEP